MATRLHPSEPAAEPPAWDGDRAPSARPAWRLVDLDRIEHNLRLLRRQVAPAAVLAVVKADAYGHGAVGVARLLEERGVEWLGVALVEEGVELRLAGLGARILVLGTCQAAELPQMRRHALLPTVSSLEQLEMWRSWAEAEGVVQPIHLKLDTGMARLGLPQEALGAALERIRGSRGLALGGLMSHLAEGDDPASPRTGEQARRFETLLERLTAEERSGCAVHLANSGGALHHPETRHTLVRLGLSLYGLDPARRFGGLRPAMSVVARIVQLRTVPAGTRPGYGGRWTAPRESRLAVVPVGYADGYSWSLSNQAEALVGGRRVPVVGAVSMDMALLDVTGVGAACGDEVVLLGEQGGDAIDAWELAERSGTIPYEVLCRFALRLPRRYRRGGENATPDPRPSPPPG